jgi:hypothetical protein
MRWLAYAGVVHAALAHVAPQNQPSSFVQMFGGRRNRKTTHIFKHSAVPNTEDVSERYLTLISDLAGVDPRDVPEPVQETVMQGRVQEMVACAKKYPRLTNAARDACVEQLLALDFDDQDQGGGPAAAGIVAASQSPEVAVGPSTDELATNQIAGITTASSPFASKKCNYCSRMVAASDFKSIGSVKMCTDCHRRNFQFTCRGCQEHKLTEIDMCQSPSTKKALGYCYDCAVKQELRFVTGDDAFASNPKQHGRARKVPVPTAVPPVVGFQQDHSVEAPSGGRTTPTPPELLHKPLPPPRLGSGSIGSSGGSGKMSNDDLTVGPSVPMTAGGLARFSGYVAQDPEKKASKASRRSLTSAAGSIQEQKADHQQNLRSRRSALRVRGGSAQSHQGEKGGFRPASPPPSPSDRDSGWLEAQNEVSH